MIATAPRSSSPDSATSLKDSAVHSRPSGSHSCMFFCWHLFSRLCFLGLPLVVLIIGFPLPARLFTGYILPFVIVVVFALFLLR